MNYTNDIMTKARSITGAVGAREFALYSKIFLAGRGIPAEMQKIGSRIASTRVQEALEAKAAVAAGSTSDATWGGNLSPFQNMAAGFVQALAGFSAFDSILPDLVQLPLKTKIIVANSSATANTVSELAPVPISKLGFSEFGFLEPTKVQAFVAVTNELAKNMTPQATGLILDNLKQAVSAATDKAFVAALTELTDISSTSSSGLSASEFLSDLSDALSAVSIGPSSKLFLLTSPDVYKTLSVLRDGSPLMVNSRIGDLINIVPSSALSDSMILLDSRGVVGVSDAVLLDPATHANVEESDAPTSAPATSINLWHSNLTGLRVTRYFGTAVLRSDAVAVISSVTV